MPWTKQRANEYYHKNKKRLLAQSKKRRESDPERIEKDRLYRLKNKERITNYAKKYRSDNIKRLTDLQREYQAAHAERRSERYFKRYYNDIQYKLNFKLRDRLRNALKPKLKDKYKDLFGCTLFELRAHIENQFKEGMSWGNRGTWHVDHIKAVKFFDLTCEDQQRACFHYSNLQPLWAKENMAKAKTIDRVDRPAIISYFDVIDWFY